MLLSSCSNYWILDTERIDEIPEIASYTKKMQDLEDSNDTKLSVHKVFTISEGRKMVVITSGKESATLEFVDLEVKKKDQKIIVKEVPNEINDMNPYLLVGLDKIKGDLQVYNESTGELIENINSSSLRPTE